MKKVLIFLIATIFATSVLASEYNYNSTGFFIYEDWNIFNDTIWSNETVGNSWKIDTGVLKSTGEDGEEDMVGIYLTNPNFAVNFTDEWDYSAIIQAGDDCAEGYGANSFHSLTMINDTKVPPATDAQWLQSIIANNGACDTPFHYLYARNDQLEIKQSGIVEEGAGLNESQILFVQKKRNMPDNISWYIETYIDGVLTTNLSDTNLTENHTLANFSDEAIFAIQTYNGADLSYQIFIEELNITLYRFGQEEPCTPDYICSGYGSCNSSDLAPCNAVTDNNACGGSYMGDYSEFVAQPCNYCSASVSAINSTCVEGTNTTCYQDANFATCCNVTLIPSDCPQNASIVCTDTSCATGGYQSSYGSGDIPAATIDFFGTAAVALVPLMGIVAMFFIGFGAFKLAIKRRK